MTTSKFTPAVPVPDQKANSLKDGGIALGTGTIVNGSLCWMWYASQGDPNLIILFMLLVVAESCGMAMMGAFLGQDRWGQSKVHYRLSQSALAFSTFIPMIVLTICYHLFPTFTTLPIAIGQALGIYFRRNLNWNAI